MMLEGEQERRNLLASPLLLLKAERSSEARGFTREKQERLVLKSSAIQFQSYGKLYFLLSESLFLVFKGI